MALRQTLSALHQRCLRPIPDWIDTPARQLCFLTQVGHESGGIFYPEELASSQAYEGRKRTEREFTALLGQSVYN